MASSSGSGTLVFGATWHWRWRYYEPWRCQTIQQLKQQNNTKDLKLQQQCCGNFKSCSASAALVYVSTVLEL